MNANAGWMISFIVVGGVMQSCGAAMNGQLNKHVVNPWLASAMSFASITFFFAGASLIHPHPLPTQKDFAELPRWSVIGGLVGAVQVYAGLTLVNKVGAGPFVGFTVTAAQITSLMIDHFGWFRMQPHPLTTGRIIGGLLSRRYRACRQVVTPTNINLMCFADLLNAFRIALPRAVRSWSRFVTRYRMLSKIGRPYIYWCRRCNAQLARTGSVPHPQFRLLPR